jgi:hypothetical protein
MKPATRRGRLRPAILLLAAALACGQAALAAPTVAILSPQDQETVHDNSGRVPVRVAVHGDALQNGSLAIELDGRPVGGPRRSASFTLQGVDRGQHSLRALLLDATGREVAASQPVTFTLWHASVLFRNRRK